MFKHLRFKIGGFGVMSWTISTFLHAAVIAVTNLPPSCSLQITSVTSGQALRKLWVQSGKTTVRIWGNFLPSNACFSGVVICALAHMICTVWRFGRFSRQSAQAVRIVAAWYLVMLTVKILAMIYEF